MKEKQFILDAKYACQDILNRYYSIEVAQQKMSPDPWWIGKIKEIERNCRAFLDGDDGFSWQRDFADKTKDTSG
tara:strand:- start:493 stop:714 length:222 start_codon:yes stop_codon:yes gene_type:complete